MVKCIKCSRSRPDGEDIVAERAWDIIHAGCSTTLSWKELKAAANEFAASHDLVRAAVAAAAANYS